jgi:hypothetical protein
MFFESPLDIIEIFYPDRKLKLFDQIQQVYCILCNEPNGLTLEEIKNIFIGSINHFENNRPIAWYIHSDIIKNIRTVLEKDTEINFFCAQRRVLCFIV